MEEKVMAGSKILDDHDPSWPGQKARPYFQDNQSR
jgi:hypothetical protein